MLTKYKIVVAHPDDEIIFFNSLVLDADEIIICYGPTSSKKITKGRANLKKNHPLKNIRFLDLKESDSYDLLSFKNRIAWKEGISVNKNETEYRNNYHVLVELIRPLLHIDDIIVTHNPWGEYGNPEHIQVFSVIKSLMAELRLKVFVSGYVSDKTWLLMTKYHYMITTDSVVKSPSNDIGEKLKAIYLKNNCWTWTNDYVWPSIEIFHGISLNNIAPLYVNTSYPPLNYLSRKFSLGAFKYTKYVLLTAMLKFLILIKIKK